MILDGSLFFLSKQMGDDGSEPDEVFVPIFFFRNVFRLEFGRVVLETYAVTS